MLMLSNKRMHTHLSPAKKSAIPRNLNFSAVVLSQFLASPISFVFSHFAVSFTGMIRLITYLLHSQTHIFHIMYVETINVFQNRFRIVFSNLCLYDYLYFRKTVRLFFTRFLYTKLTAI